MAEDPDGEVKELLRRVVLRLGHRVVRLTLCGGQLNPTQRIDRCSERHQVAPEYSLDLLHVDPVVLMGEQITQAGDLTPRNLWALRFCLVAQTFHDLTEDHEVVEDGIAPQTFVRTPIARVSPDRLDRPRD